MNQLRDWDVQRLARMRQLMENYQNANDRKQGSFGPYTLGVLQDEIKDLEQILMPEHYRPSFGGFLHRLSCPTFRSCPDQVGLYHELEEVKRGINSGAA